MVDYDVYVRRSGCNRVEGSAAGEAASKHVGSLNSGLGSGHGACDEVDGDSRSVIVLYAAIERGRPR